MKLTEFNLNEYVTYKVNHLLNSKTRRANARFCKRIYADCKALGINGNLVIEQIIDLVDLELCAKRKTLCEVFMAELK